MTEAIGRMGTPRKLDVMGENQAKVVYRLTDPEQYKQQHVLVVGGGDSALEAAISISEQPGTTVTLSYRSEAFGRVKPKNRQRLQDAEASNRLKVLLKSTINEIRSSSVKIETADEAIRPSLKEGCMEGGSRCGCGWGPIDRSDRGQHQCRGEGARFCGPAATGAVHNGTPWRALTAAAPQGRARPGFTLPSALH